jgi:hypothetical protein
MSQFLTETYAKLLETQGHSEDASAIRKLNQQLEILERLLIHVQTKKNEKKTISD